MNPDQERYAHHRGSNYSHPKQKGWLTIVVVSGLILAMATLSLLVVQENKTRATALAEKHLPLLENTQNLRLQLAATQSILYAYYLTADREGFGKQFIPNFANLADSYKQIQEQIPEARGLDAIDSLIVDTLDLSNSFDRVMRAEKIDWDQARAVLDEFPAIARQMDIESEQLTLWIRNHIIDAAQRSIEHTQWTLISVTLLGLASLLALALMINHNRKRLEALREQIRLVTFPERNPFPVISIRDSGTIAYSNNSALDTAAKLTPDGDIQALLPDNLDLLLAHAREDHSYHQLEYEKYSRFWSLGLHWLADFQEYHVYLSDITDRKTAENRLTYLAYHDSLTGLPNRLQFNRDRLNNSANHSVVAVIKLDHLQKVINTGGLALADKVLKAFTERLLDTLAQEQAPGHLYRFDGNLLCATFPDWRQGMQILEALRTAITPLFAIDGYEYFLTLSIGVARIGENAIRSKSATANKATEEILRQADSAMNVVKVSGGNGIQVYDTALDRHHQQQIILENDLRQALDRNELSLVFSHNWPLTVVKSLAPKPCCAGSTANSALSHRRSLYPWPRKRAPLSISVTGCSNRLAATPFAGKTPTENRSGLRSIFPPGSFFTPIWRPSLPGCWPPPAYRPSTSNWRSLKAPPWRISTPPAGYLES